MMLTVFSFMMICIPIQFFISDDSEGLRYNRDPTSGSCGYNAQWSYDAPTKTLTISGTGSMTDYDLFASYRYGTYQAPWRVYEYEIKTIIIGPNITHISDAMLPYSSSLTTVIIKGPLESIGEYAFYNCHNLTICLDSNIKVGEDALTGTNHYTTSDVTNFATGKLALIFTLGFFFVLLLYCVFIDNSILKKIRELYEI